jgi:predicted SnoaL-like aldol condensation-catalyzing enzyme
MRSGYVLPDENTASTHQRHTISDIWPLRKEARIVAGQQALVIRLFNEVFTSRNPSAADDIMADEYFDHAVEPFGREEPGPVDGPSHAREVVARLRAPFPDLEMTIESIVADTDMVAVRVRSAGTNLGKLGGFAPPTNKRFVAEQSHCIELLVGSSASTGRHATTSPRCSKWE